jgi:hexosaminidase
MSGAVNAGFLARRLGLVAGLVAALCAAATPGALAVQPRTIPALREWTDGAGSYTFSAGSRIVLDATNEAELSTTAEVFSEDLLTLTGYTIPVTTGAASVQAGDIYLSLGATDPAIGQEGYLLTIADFLAISAQTDAGVFFGTRSVLQMLRQGFQIQAGTARDWPDYPERGMMVDTGRKFYSVEFLERHIKELAYLKLNYFHLHLSDQDAYGGYGFRLQSVTHPEITSPRHYSPLDIQSLLALAQAYHVMIVPEIDVPSHALPLLAPHPDLQLPGTSGKVDLSNPASYVLIQDLLNEFLPQFPAPYWHTGGDEYLADSEYANFPQLQAYAQQLYGPSANAQDVYIGFVNWVDAIVKSHGKQLRAWNDLYGVTGNVNAPNPDIILEMWYPYISPQDALSKGHTILNCSYLTLYYVLGGDGLTNDPANTINLYENWAPHLQFPDLTYQWPGSINLDPLTPGLRGGKFHIWCDYPNAQTEAQVQNGIVNHLRGLAQNSWGSAKLVPTYQAFLQIIDPVGHTPDYGPDFTLTTAAASATIAAGQTATYSLQLTPLMGFNQPTSLSCTSNVPESLCSITPPNLTPGGTPASPSTITVSISTAPFSSASNLPALPQPTIPLSCVCFALIVAGVITRRRHDYWVWRRGPVFALGSLLLLSQLLSVSCGPSGRTSLPPARTPAGNYTVTVLASSQTLTHQISLSLSVQ